MALTEFFGNMPYRHHIENELKFMLEKLPNRCIDLQKIRRLANVITEMSRDNAENFARIRDMYSNRLKTEKTLKVII